MCIRDRAYYNAQAGIRKLVTETGAGQWGSALAFATEAFGMECEVYQVRSTYESKPYRRVLMATFGATVYPSPSDHTATGRAMRERFPDTPGSLGMAISEAVEVAATNEGVNYSLGSVLNHVLLHQTVIGLETIKQLELFGEQMPDQLFACAGGGSNLGGIALPFLRENLEGRASTTITACESAAAPSLTQGEYRYDHGDTSGMTPLLKMYSLGADFVPDPVHAGGLRYHGMAPIISHCYHEGMMQAIAVKQREAFGRTVSEFQNTQFELADCWSMLLSHKAFLDRCIERHLKGQLDAVEASAAKLRAKQVFWFSDVAA